MLMPHESTVAHEDRDGGILQRTRRWLNLFIAVGLYFGVKSIVLREMIFFPTEIKSFVS
jgi:hypothetical protein